MMITIMVVLNDSDGSTVVIERDGSSDGYQYQRRQCFSSNSKRPIAHPT